MLPADVDVTADRQADRTDLRARRRRVNPASAAITPRLRRERGEAAVRIERSVTRPRRTSAPGGAAAQPWLRGCCCAGRRWRSASPGNSRSAPGWRRAG